MLRYPTDTYMVPHNSRGRGNTVLGDRYQVAEVLAEGGMSVLFTGTDLSTGLPVAIKSLRPYDFGSPSRRARFQHEIEAARRLRHPNIVRVLDSGDDARGAPYLVMELLRGASLDQELAARGKLPAEQALQWLLPLVGALCYAHEHGVVHRDLKPANIFLARDENGRVEPKLLDFGISVVADATRVTQSGTVVGTVQYMSPEQARDEEVVAASDVWAMGVVLYHCLSGTVPFVASTAAGLLYKIVHEAPRELISNETEVGPKFCAAVDRALAKGLTRRYPDMRSFALALCLSARAEGIRLPEAPDPIGLPEWPSWYSGDAADYLVTGELASEPAQPDEAAADSTVRKLSKFVGRSSETEQLLQAYRRAANGRGQVVGIVGEAGVGKSRLLLETKRLLPAGACVYVEGRCQDQYGSATSYFPILQLLKSYFRIKEGASAAQIQQALRDGVLELDDRLVSMLSPLRDLFGVEVEDEMFQALDPQTKKERVIGAVADFLIRVSEDTPLVIAIEDLHWVDKSSQQVIDRLVSSVLNARILLLLLFRPEYTHGWAGHARYSEINLTRLDTGASAALVQSILGESRVATELKDLIRNRAQGNPLFTEELTHNLLENGSITKQSGQYVLAGHAVSMPSLLDVQATIASRMDHLEQSLKQTLQMASVVGPDFASRILQSIAGMQEELDSHLKHLQRMDFIYKRSSTPETSFVFKHALTQQTAYDSLQSDKRGDIHEKTARALEEIYSDHLEEFYETLAHHYTHAENCQKAARYLDLSGQKAARNYSGETAVQFFEQALSMFSRLPQTEDHKRQQLDIRMRLNYQYVMQDYPAGSLDNMREMEKLSRALGDSRSMALAYTALNVYFAHSGNPMMSASYAEVAFREALKTEDVEILAPLIITLVTVYLQTGDMPKMLEIGPKAIDFIKKAGRETDSFNLGIVVYSWLCAGYGCALGLSGDFERGEAFLDDAICTAGEAGHLPTMGLCQTACSVLHGIRGRGQLAIWHAQKALDSLERGGWFWVMPVALAALGVGHFMLGELQTAKEHLEKACETQAGQTSFAWAYIPYLNLSLVNLDLGEYRQAQHLAEKAIQMGKDSDDKLAQAMVLPVRGLALGLGDPSQCARAKQDILNAAEVHEGLGTRSMRVLTPVALSQLYADTGQKEKALEYIEDLKQSIEQMRQMGMDYWVARAGRILASIKES